MSFTVAAVATGLVAVLWGGAPLGGAGTAVPAFPPGTTGATTVACGPRQGDVSCALVNQVCARTGGAGGLGYDQFGADQQEFGRSGVRQFEQQAQLQYESAGRWLGDSRVLTVRSPLFPNDPSSYYFRYSWRGTYGPDEVGRPARVVWRGLWLDGSGGVLAETAAVSVGCPAA